MAPPTRVLEAFGVRGNPVCLSSGLWTTFQVGESVLKQSHNEVEAIWVIEILSGIEERGFRAPHYLTADDGDVLVEGWMAYEFLPGKMLEGHWAAKREALELFHSALKEIPPPPFFANRNDPWALADFMAWGDLPITCHKRLKPAVDQLMSCLKPIQVTNQIIQGDPANILFEEGLPPAIIDFCPYWRPSDFALAILVVDALVWKDAEPSILKWFEDICDFDQLLVRAELRRLLELDGHYRQFGEDCLDEVDEHLPTIEFICTRIDG
ncbi:MAG: hypothetical protein ACFFCW_42870 [Candidatus Hodarchaeota archaeon]